MGFLGTISIRSDALFHFAMALSARDTTQSFSRFISNACLLDRSFEIQDGGLIARWKFVFYLQKMRWDNKQILASISTGKL